MVAMTGCWKANGNDNISSEGKIMTQEGEWKVCLSEALKWAKVNRF